MTPARGLGIAPPGAVGPAVVRDRPWLVSDALVGTRLAAHPVLPVRDVVLQRSARAVAFALGLLTLPDAGLRSIAAVDVRLDADRLAERVALPASAIGEAFRALWVADVLRHGTEPGTARFADDVVPESSLAHALRWNAIAERLLERRGEGSLAAVMLFRVVLDRLTHPRAPATLPASLAADQLGLSEDQTRRGLKLLQARGLLVEQPQSGRAKQYLLGDDVLVGRPAAAPATAPQAALQAGPPAGDAAPATEPAPAVAVRGPGGPLIEYLGQRIELPAQAELSLAVPGTRVAAMRVDPATGRLVVALEPEP